MKTTISKSKTGWVPGKENLAQTTELLLEDFGNLNELAKKLQSVLDYAIFTRKADVLEPVAKKIKAKITVRIEIEEVKNAKKTG